MAKVDATTTIIYKGDLTGAAKVFVEGSETAKSLSKPIDKAKKILVNGILEEAAKDLNRVRPSIFTNYKVDVLQKEVSLPDSEGNTTVTEHPTGKVAQVVLAFAGQNIEHEVADELLQKGGKGVYDKLVKESVVISECSLTDALTYALEHMTDCSVACGEDSASISIKNAKSIPGVKTKILVQTVPDFLNVVRDMDVDQLAPVKSIVTRIIKAGLSASVRLGERELD